MAAGIRLTTEALRAGSAGLLGDLDGLGAPVRLAALAPSAGHPGLAAAIDEAAAALEAQRRSCAAMLESLALDALGVAGAFESAELGLAGGARARG